MGDLNEAKSARATAKGIFTRNKTALVKSLDREQDVTLVIERFHKLEISWSEVQNAYEHYARECEKSQVQCDPEWIDKAADEFDEVEVRKQGYINTSAAAKSVEQESARKKEVKEQLDGAKSSMEMEEEMFNLQKKELESMMAASISNDNPLIAMENLLGDIKRQFQKCRDACVGYSKLVTDKVKSKEIMEASNKFTTDYIDVQKRCSIKIEAFKKDKDKRKPKLDTMKLPVFNGNIREYPRFKRDFTTLFQPNIAHEATAYVLRSCLKKSSAYPNPLDLIKNVDDDVKCIWEVLDEHFGSASKLVDLVMNDVRNTKRVTEENSEEMVQLIDLIDKSYKDLKNMNMESEMANCHTVSLIEERLPPSVKLDWAKKVKRKENKIEDRNKFPHLLDFLLEHRKVLEYVNAGLRCKADEAKSRDYIHTTTTTTSNSMCIIHKAASRHSTQDCKEFIQKSNEDKVKLIKEVGACMGCLRTGHKALDCDKRIQCPEENCGKRHHRLLHEAFAAGIHFLAEGKAIHSNKTDNLRDKVLLQIMNIETNENRKVNVLFDNGATLSLITFNKAEQLQLKGTKIKLLIVKVGGVEEYIDSYLYNLYLKDKKGFTVAIKVAGVPRISNDLEYLDVSEVPNIFPNIDKEEIERPKGEIDVLFGYEYAAWHPRIKDIHNHLVILENRFGKCLAGTSAGFTEGSTNLIQCAQIHYASANIIEDFFNAESIGISCKPKCGRCGCGTCAVGDKTYSIREERELHLIEQGLSFHTDHWVAKFPWLRNPEELPDNFTAAAAILNSSENRLMKNPSLAGLYEQQIQEMVSNKVARKLSKQEIREYKGPVHYASHHEVLKPESISTPLRIVMNLSGKYKGHVINEYWAKGPDLMNSLPGLIVRLREKKHGVIGDIRRMYHSVKIDILEQHTHRFLWRNLDKSRPPDIYVMTTLSFGDKPAQCIATVALRKTAEMGRQQYPDAYETILKNTYVDDIADSVNSEEEANALASSIDKLIEPGGFFIKEWEIAPSAQHTNGSDPARKEVSWMQDETAQFGTSTGEDGRQSSSTQKVLGVCWKRPKDVITFVVKLNFSQKKRGLRTEEDLTREDFDQGFPSKLTKRRILSVINGVFDPLGIAAPFTVRAKILMRKLWKKDQPPLGWDDEVPIDLYAEWKEFFKEMLDMDRVEFKRCMRPTSATEEDPVLVLFSDGSESAYGACAYARWKLKDGTFEASLIMSKNRVAPVKRITVVRMEMSGALLAARPCKFIKEGTRLKFSKTLIQKSASR